MAQDFWDNRLEVKHQEGSEVEQPQKYPSQKGLVW